MSVTNTGISWHRTGGPSGIEWCMLQQQMYVNEQMEAAENLCCQHTLKNVGTVHPGHKTEPLQPPPHKP